VRRGGRRLGVVDLTLKLLPVVLLAACGSGGGFPDAFKAPPPPDPGTFAMSWTLADGSGAPVTCAAASASTVHVAIVDEAGGAQFTSNFDCGLTEAVSGSLPVGTYDLSFALDGVTVITTAPAQMGVVISSDQTTSIAVVAFVVPAS
jgi:hypothetical protein